jgi:hypothetical protein
MQYTRLPEEVRKELESKKKAMVRRGSLVGDTSVNDVVLLDKSSKADANKLNGYTEGLVSVWFEFVSAPYGEDEAKCLELANNALK